VFCSHSVWTDRQAKCEKQAELLQIPHHLSFARSIHDVTLSMRTFTHKHTHTHIYTHTPHTSHKPRTKQVYLNERTCTHTSLCSCALRQRTPPQTASSSATSLVPTTKPTPCTCWTSSLCVSDEHRRSCRLSCTPTSSLKRGASRHS